jgi:hypothetical protein
LNTKLRHHLFSKRNLSIGLAFILVALIAGVYFLFKPFPAGPSLEVRANILNVPAGKVAASVAGSYANHTVGLREAASVAGWSAYANPPTIVRSEDVQKPQNPKSTQNLRRR